MCAVAVAGSPAFSPSMAAGPSSEAADSPPSPCMVSLQMRQGMGRGLGPAVLKRKRPARLDIPLCLPVVAAAEAAAVKVVEAEAEKYAVFCKKGRREVMEDRHSAAVNLEGDRKTAFFGVFDGHGGEKAAEFAAEHIVQYVMREVTKSGRNGIEEAVRRGYHRTDKDFLGKGLNGGTCCVTALIRNGSLFVSNAGDCRAVMSRNGVADALTVDQRPSREDERERIQKLVNILPVCLLFVFE